MDNKRTTTHTENVSSIIEIPSVPPLLSKPFRSEMKHEWTIESGVSEKYYTQLIEDGFLTVHDVTILLKALKHPRKDEEGLRWAIRGIDPTTNEPLPSISQAKLASPRLKYVSPKGSGSDALFLPLMNDYTWEKAIAESGLVVCEGAKKAAALISIGYAAISAIGCQCFYTKDAKGNIRSMLSWAVEIAKKHNQPVRIIPDGDIDTNENVSHGTVKACLQYIDDGVDCRVIHFASKGKGIDDHLATLDEVDRWDEVGRIMSQEYPLDAIKAKLEKQFDSSSDDKEDHSAIALSRAFADIHRETMRYDLSQQVFRQWNRQYWEAMPLEAIHQQVRAFAFSSGFKMKTPSLYEKATQDTRLELLVREWHCADRKTWINFRNGVYNTATREFYEGDHRPDLLLTSCLDRDFTPITPNENNILQLVQEYCPVFYKWALQAQGKDALILKLIAIINAVVTYRFAELQMFLHTYGKPGTGKGTFNRLLEKLVGTENHTSTRLGKLTNDYEIASFIDKQLVICPDEDKVFGQYSGLKSLTGGDTISYRPIYGKPARAKFNGTLVITANDAVFGGDTTGLDRRMCIQGFNNVVKDRDPLIEDALADELSALTSVALWMPPEQVKSLITGKDEVDLTEKWQLKVEADAIARWMDESLYVCSVSFIPVSSFGDEDAQSGHETLYSNYQSFCRENGFNPGNASTLGKRLREYAEFLGWTLKDVRKVPWGSKRVPCIQGVAFRGEHNAVPTISELLGQGVMEQVISEVSGENDGLSGECQGECQGKESLNHAGCQGSQGENPKLLREPIEVVAEFFGGKILELDATYPDCPDTLDTASVSALTQNDDDRASDWQPGDGFYVGQEVGKYDVRVPVRLRRMCHRQEGWHGVVREVTETCIQVWWFGTYERTRDDKLKRDSKGKHIEKWSRCNPEDLLDWHWGTSP